MLGSELQKYINQLYPQIEKTFSAKKVKDGYLGHNYVLESNNEKYFLKQYMEGYTEAEIQDIHKVIQFFSSKNIPAILPIQNINKKTYFTCNSKIFTLFPFVNGIKKDVANMSDQAIKSLAKTLAKMHLLNHDGPALEICHKQKGLDTEKFLKSHTQITKHINSKKTKDSFDILALKVLKLKKDIVENNIKKIQDFKFPSDHLVHGDYQVNNIFFDNNGEVQYIFDWERAHIGSRFHELIRSMDYNFLDGEYKQKNFDMAKLYLQTYRELSPFNTKGFINSFQGYYFNKAHSLWIERTHYLENSNRVDCFLEREFACLSYFPENWEDVLIRIGF